MNFNNLLLPLVFALAMTWGLYYFIGKNAPQEPTEQVKSGQSFTAPKVAYVHKPLNTEIDFIDRDINYKGQKTLVETPLLRLLFTEEGGAVQNITFKRVQGGIERALTTLDVADSNKDQFGFLVALPEKTPLKYSLVDKQETVDEIKLYYTASTEQVGITKLFTVYKSLYKIDLAITVEPKVDNQAELDVRVFVPAPALDNVEDGIFGIVNTESNTLKTLSRTKELTEQYWVSPTLFGGADRYFVHALTADPAHFVQRAYYAPRGLQSLNSILESNVIKGKSSWELSFYIGPKESEAMLPVDPRLEGIIDYGWFKPLSKFMLMILKLLYSYVGNYGVAIILLTLLIRLVLLPFTWRGEQGGLQKRAELQKKMRYLEQKYKDNKELLMREKADLIKKQGLPDLASCLPLLLQIPIFISLNRVLSSSIELYQAPFFGWITDLSAKDPYYILPLIVGLGTMLQLGSVGNPRERLPGFLAAIVLAAVMSGLSAGLSLYFAASTWLGIAQTKLQKMAKL
jgi:YidC/Oxa1 family membrane protein insertase